MKKEMLKNSKIFVVILLFIGASFLSGVSAISTDNKDLKNYNQEIINPENECNNIQYYSGFKMAR